MEHSLSTDDLFKRLVQIDSRRDDHLLVLDDVALDPEELFARCRSGPLHVLPSSDGPLSVVQEDDSSVDFNHHGRGFDFHTDGLYYDLIPDFVILYCLSAGTQSTLTTFADTRKAAQRIERDEGLATLRQCESVYVGRDGCAYAQPLIARHPRSGEPILHITARGFIRPQVSEDAVASMGSLRDFIHAQNELFALLDESVVCRHRWNANQLILFDNFSFVHAREVLGRDPDRKLYRIWLCLGREHDRINRKLLESRKAVQTLTG